MRCEVKKVLSIITICSLLFILGNQKVIIAKEDAKVVDVVDNDTTNLQIKFNENDDEKNRILNILYHNTAEEIMRYLKYDEDSVIIHRDLPEPSDDLKEKCVNYLLEKHFKEDLQIQKKIKQLPLDCQFNIYERMILGKHMNTGESLEVICNKIANFLYHNTVEEILCYLEHNGDNVIIHKITAKPSDELKEKCVNHLLEEHFKDNLQIQEKIKQLPLDYQYYIYEKLK